MSLAAEEKNKDPEGYSARIKQMEDDLLRISNVVSAQILDYYLRQNPERKNIALYIGKEHKPMVEMDILQIPEDLKLTDGQIKNLLEKRERTRIEEVFSYGMKLSGEKKIPAMPKLATQQRIETKIEAPPSKKMRVSGALNEILNIPERDRAIIEKWSNNLFDLEYVRKRGYQEYLNSDDSLRQVWGAAALLAEKVEKATIAGRELLPEETAEIREAFLKAAETRKLSYGLDSGQGSNELIELANNIDILAKVIKKINHS